METANIQQEQSRTARHTLSCAVWVTRPIACRCIIILFAGHLHNTTATLTVQPYKMQHNNLKFNQEIAVTFKYLKKSLTFRFRLALTG